MDFWKKIIINIQGVVGIHTLALFSFQFCISFILVNNQTTNLIRLNKPLEQLKAKKNSIEIYTNGYFG